MTAAEQYRRDRARRLAIRGEVEHLVRLGYLPFPVVAGGKVPMFSGWQAIARGDKVERLVVPDEGDPYHERVPRPPIGSHWATGTPPNIGIMTGTGHRRQPWSLLVIDVDVRSGGDQSVKRLPRLPETAVVDTPGGWHLYFRHPATVRYRNAVGGRGRGIAEGIDHRGQGGFVVAPPSVRPEGVYRWRTGPVALSDLAEVPEWLHDVLSEVIEPEMVSHAAGGTTPMGDGWARGEALLAEDWLVNAHRLLSDRPEGDRNDLLASLLTKGLFFAADGLLATDTVIEVLSDAAATSGLPAHEVAATTTSISNYVDRSILP